MEVHVTPETAKKLTELAATTGRAPDQLVEDALLGAICAALVLLVPHYAAGQQAAPGGRGNQGPADLRTTNSTVYTPKTELFITFRPTFIVGEVTRIGAHLSRLGDRFTPYAENTVAVTLNVAGVDTKTSVPKPDRPGSSGSN